MIQKLQNHTTIVWMLQGKIIHNEETRADKKILIRRVLKLWCGHAESCSGFITLTNSTMSLQKPVKLVKIHQAVCSFV